MEYRMPYHIANAIKYARGNFVPFWCPHLYFALQLWHYFFVFVHYSWAGRDQTDYILFISCAYVCWMQASWVCVRNGFCGPFFPDRRRLHREKKTVSFISTARIAFTLRKIHRTSWTISSQWNRPWKLYLHAVATSNGSSLRLNLITDVWIRRSYVMLHPELSYDVDVRCRMHMKSHAHCSCWTFAQKINLYLSRWLSVCSCTFNFIRQAKTNT